MKHKTACTISDDWTYKGMKVIFMENEYLRIGILAGRGSDIFEFRYKPHDLDFLLRLPKGIQNPAHDFSQVRSTPNQFEDYYYGGWQEILPNSPMFNYRGALLGLHGEVSLIPWKYAILKDSEEEVAVKFQTRPLRMPLLIEKVLTINKDDSKLKITEKLTNEGNTHLDIMWGHHIAFGLPFLKNGASIETNAKTMEADPSITGPRRFSSGKLFNWPMAVNSAGAVEDASKIPPIETDPYRDLCYLKGYDTKAHYSIKNETGNIGFRLDWNGDLFKCLWLWEERFATLDFPWWGKCFTVALEPWTSCYTQKPEEAIAKGEWLHLEAGQVVITELTAEAFQIVHSGG
jgi:Domain of unknown function (DUF4432)